MQRGSFRHNFSWMLIGNVVYAASQWGILVILAKLGNVEMVGQYGLGLAVTSPIFLLLNSGLTAVLATDARGEYEFRDYSATRLTTIAAAVTTTLGIAFASRWSRATLILVIAIAGTKSVEAFSDLFYGLFQRREVLERTGKSMVLRGVLSLCAAGAAVWLFSNPLAAALAVLVVWTAVLFRFDWANGAAVLGGKRALVPRFKLPSMGALMRAALPLGIVWMLISLMTNVPRYFIEHSRGSRDLGIFVGLAHISIAASLVINALGTAAIARLSSLYARGEIRAFRDLTGRLTLYAAAVGFLEIAVAVLVGRPALRLLYTAEYASHQTEFIILMLAAAIGHVASFLGYATTAARVFTAQIPLWLVVVIAVAGVSAWLVPPWGILGATWALVAGAAVQLATYGLLYGRLFSAPVSTAAARPTSVDTLGSGSKK